MTGSTARFGLITLNERDELGAEDHRFGGADRILLDRLLGDVTEHHVHTGVPASTVPSVAPLVRILPTGGTFPANRTVLYRVALVDPRGQEYLASQQATIVTPPGVTTPGPPTLAQSVGGSLPPGDYLYLLAAYTDSTGYETAASPTVSGTLVAGNGWTIRFPVLPAGATGWNIYRKSPGDPEPVFLHSTTEDIEVADDGSVQSSPYRSVPTANTTSSTSVVQITLPDDLPAGYTMRIYRTLDQSDWSSSLVTRTAVLPFTDTGHATQSGGPPARSVAFGGAPKIVFGPETEGTLPPACVTTTEMVSFAMAGPVVRGYSPWQWVCEYEQAIIVSVRASLGRGSAPASQPVRVGLDVERGDGWTPLLTGALDRVETSIAVGQQIGPLTAVEPGQENLPLIAGHALRAEILQTGGGASSTDADLSIVVMFAVSHGAATTTYTWKED